MCASVVENRTLRIPVFCTAYLVQTPSIHPHTHSHTYTCTHTHRHTQTHTHTLELNLLRCLYCVLDKGRLADGELQDANRTNQASTTSLQSTPIGIKVFFVFFKFFFRLFLFFLKALGRILMHSRIIFTWKTDFTPS